MNCRCVYAIHTWGNVVSIIIYLQFRNDVLFAKDRLITSEQNVNVNLKEMNANDLQFVAGSKVVVVALADSLRPVRS